MPSAELLAATTKLPKAVVELRDTVLGMDDDLFIGPPPPAFVSEVASTNEADRFEERRFMSPYALGCRNVTGSSNLTNPFQRFPEFHGRKLDTFIVSLESRESITPEIRHSGSLCFKGTGLLETASFQWNDLVRAHSLALAGELYQIVKTFTSITPPVQEPYLLKCVPPCHRRLWGHDF